MNAVAKQTNYISAYPLKVLLQAATSSADTPQSPHLIALLTKRTSSLTRIRVAPMADPYKVQINALPLRPTAGSQPEPQGKDWFNHYE